MTARSSATQRDTGGHRGCEELESCAIPLLAELSRFRKFLLDTGGENL
jgi:hypothetical protein